MAYKSIVETVDTTVQDFIDELKKHNPKAHLYIFSDDPNKRWVINNVYPPKPNTESDIDHVERWVEINILDYDNAEHKNIEDVREDK